MPLTLANVYFPNKACAQFCRRFIEELKSFASGCIIQGGDFNVALNPLQDTSSGNSSLTYCILKNIKMSLQSLTVIDSWCVLNLTGKDYTYYSSPHDRYTHIDYVFVAQRNLPTLIDAQTSIQTYSDHAPVSITLTPPEPRTKPYMWRLNPSILTDPDALQKTTDTMRNYFAENCTEDFSPL